MNYGLLWSILAHYFGLLGVPGSPRCDNVEWSPHEAPTNTQATVPVMLDSHVLVPSKMIGELSYLRRNGSYILPQAIDTYSKTWKYHLADSHKK